MASGSSKKKKRKDPTGYGAYYRNQRRLQRKDKRYEEKQAAKAPVMGPPSPMGPPVPAAIARPGGKEREFILSRSEGAINKQIKNWREARMAQIADSYFEKREDGTYKTEPYTAPKPKEGRDQKDIERDIERFERIAKSVGNDPERLAKIRERFLKRNFETFTHTDGKVYPVQSTGTRPVFKKGKEKDYQKEVKKLRGEIKEIRERGVLLPNRQYQLQQLQEKYTQPGFEFNLETDVPADELHKVKQPLELWDPQDDKGSRRGMTNPNMYLSDRQVQRIQLRTQGMKDYQISDLFKEEDGPTKSWKNTIPKAVADAVGSAVSTVSSKIGDAKRSVDPMHRLNLDPPGMGESLLQALDRIPKPTDSQATMGLGPDFTGASKTVGEALRRAPAAGLDLVTRPGAFGGTLVAKGLVDAGVITDPERVAKIKAANNALQALTKGYSDENTLSGADVVPGYGFLYDVATDPLVAFGPVGGLTKAGRAARLSALTNANRLERFSPQLVQEGPIADLLAEANRSGDYFALSDTLKKLADDVKAPRATRADRKRALEQIKAYDRVDNNDLHRLLEQAGASAERFTDKHGREYALRHLAGAKARRAVNAHFARRANLDRRGAGIQWNLRPFMVGPEIKLPAIPLGPLARVRAIPVLNTRDKLLAGSARVYDTVDDLADYSARRNAVMREMPEDTPEEKFLKRRALENIDEQQRWRDTYSAQRLTDYQQTGRFQTFEEWLRRRNDMRLQRTLTKLTRAQSKNVAHEVHEAIRIESEKLAGNILRRFTDPADSRAANAVTTSQQRVAYHMFGRENTGEGALIDEAFGPLNAAEQEAVDNLRRINEAFARHGHETGMLQGEIDDYMFRRWTERITGSGATDPRKGKESVKSPGIAGTSPKFSMHRGTPDVFGFQDPETLAQHIQKLGGHDLDRARELANELFESGRIRSQAELLVQLTEAGVRFEFDKLPPGLQQAAKAAMRTSNDLSDPGTVALDPNRGGRALFVDLPLNRAALKYGLYRVDHNLTTQRTAGGILRLIDEDLQPSIYEGLTDVERWAAQYRDTEFILKRIEQLRSNTTNPKVLESLDYLRKKARENRAALRVEEREIAKQNGPVIERMYKAHGELLDAEATIESIRHEGIAAFRNSRKLRKEGRKRRSKSGRPRYTVPHETYAEIRDEERIVEEMAELLLHEKKRATKARRELETMQRQLRRSTWPIDDVESRAWQSFQHRAKKLMDDFNKTADEITTQLEAIDVRLGEQGVSRKARAILTKRRERLLTRLGNAELDLDHQFDRMRVEYEERGLKFQQESREPFADTVRNYGFGARDPEVFVTRLGDTRQTGTGTQPVSDIRQVFAMRADEEAAKLANRQRYQAVDDVVGLDMDYIRERPDRFQPTAARDSQGNPVEWLDVTTGQKYARPRHADKPGGLGDDIENVLGVTDGNPRLWPVKVLDDMRVEMLRYGASGQLYNDFLESGVQRAMGMFRYGVTTLFPGYHIRNMVSDVLLSMMADPALLFHPINAMKMSALAMRQGKRGTYRIPGTKHVLKFDVKKHTVKVPGFDKPMQYEDFLFMMDLFGVRTSRHMAEFVALSQSDRARNVALSRAALGFGPSGAIGRRAVEFGARREDIMRLNTFMQSMRRTKGDVAEAAGDVIKFHFDYSDLTTVEKRWARNVFLFYTWYRNNIPLQLQMMFTRPGYFAGVNHFATNLTKGEVPFINQDWSQVYEPLPDMRGDVSEAQPLLPDYLTRDLASLQVPWNGQVLSLAFGAPWEDMNMVQNLFSPQAFSQWEKNLSLLSPLFSVPIQLTTGKDPITGRQYGTDTDHLGDPKYELFGSEVIAVPRMYDWIAKKLKIDLPRDSQGRPALPWRASILLGSMPFFGRASNYTRTPSDSAPSKMDEWVHRNRGYISILGLNPSISGDKVDVWTNWIKERDFMIDKAYSGMDPTQKELKKEALRQRVLAEGMALGIPKRLFYTTPDTAWSLKSKEGRKYDPARKKPTPAKGFGSGSRGKTSGWSFNSGGDYGFSGKPKKKKVDRYSHEYRLQKIEEDKKKSAKEKAKAQKRKRRLWTAAEAAVTDPNAKALMKDAVKAAEITEVPASVLLALAGQESSYGVNTGPSSAGARGVTQFIPSTRQHMIDTYNVDPWADSESAMIAAGYYLQERGWSEDPQKALSGYSGGYPAADYNNPILAQAEKYAALDKVTGKPPKTAKKDTGPWEGTQRVAEKLIGDKFLQVATSRKRAPDHPLSIANPSSDHNEANTNAYAVDLPYDQEILDHLNKKLGTNLTLGQDLEMEYKGMHLQLLTSPHGTGLHIHVGIRNAAAPNGPSYSGSPSGGPTTYNLGEVVGTPPAPGSPEEYAAITRSKRAWLDQFDAMLSGEEPLSTVTLPEPTNNAPVPTARDAVKRAEDIRRRLRI